LIAGQENANPKKDIFTELLDKNDSS